MQEMDMHNQFKYFLEKIVEGNIGKKLLEKQYLVKYFLNGLTKD